ncbi:UvrD-helicase domain-containing protein [Candidatus Phytoplasma solani]|uniref:UvrD-helicase domain-containing protein n=1 Tax=Candidatus Phytoplasma solani TaxID=69896 RepID=UPI00358E286F
MILNKEQQAAINDDSQVYFLQAGAGTGKTTTLIAKHRNEVLLSDKRMLITSFTRHVIENIEAQINFCGYTEYKTIHGLSLKVISYYYYLKEKGSFEIESNSDYLIKKTILKIFKDKNYLATKKKVDDLLKQIKKINKGILESNDDVIENDKKNDKEEGKEEGKEERKLTLNELYESIRKEQKEKNAFTFDELIYLATKLLERDFSLRDYFSSLYDYIFIDEFQDLTINQLNLIVYLNFKKNKGFFVGDFNQQINSFQGSDLNYSKDFLKLINAKYGCLKENYRNPKVILDSSNNLIEQKLSLNNREQGELLHETFSTEQKELDYIFDKIKIMLKCGIKEEQIAVIAPQRAIYTKLLREVQKSGLFNIRFATIHRVKGLEYDYVFLMGCEDTYFKYDNMEHKRLFYVAMTRAKKRLILSTVYNRKNYYFYYAMLPKQEKIKQLLHQEEIQKLSLDKLSQVGLKKLGFDSYSFSLLKQMSLFNLSQDLLKKLDVLDLCQDELKAVLMQDKEIKFLLKKQCIELLIKNVLGDFVIEYMKALIPVKSKACYYLTDIKIKDGIKAYLVKEILNVNLGLNDITISKTVKDEIEKLKDDYLSLYSSSKSDDYFRKFYSALVYSKETDNGLFIKRQNLGYNLWRINMEYQLFRIKKKHIEVKDGLDYDSKSKDKKKDDKRYIIKSKKTPMKN